MQVSDVVEAVLNARRAGTRLTLDYAALDGPVELDPENLSVSVPAGHSLAALHERLAEAGLFYPPAADLVPAGTVGCHLGAATCGPWRLGRGTARDWVLGLEAVTGEGALVRTGSGVVKNVAGLDLTKLLIGSRGRLAVITRAHLRLAPLPERRATVGARFTSPAGALEALPALVGSALAPTAVELRDSTLLVGLEGTERDLARRLDQAAAAMRAAGGELLSEPPTLVTGPLPCPDGSVWVQAGLPAGRAARWVGALPGGTPIHGHAGNGIYRCAIPDDGALLGQLQALARELGGYLTAEPGRSVPAVDALTARVTAVFDPDSIFSEEGAHG